MSHRGCPRGGELDESDVRPSARHAHAADDARALPWRWDERTLRDTPNLTLQTDAGPLDLLSQVAGLGGYSEVLQAAVTIQVAGLQIEVLDLPGLMQAKRAAGRAKDVAILPLLESTLLLRAREGGTLSQEPPESTDGYRR